MRSLATTTFTNCTSTKFTLDISEPSISKKCWLSAQTLNGDGRNMFKGYTSIPATTMSALLVENDTVEQFKYTQPLSPLSAYASKVKKNTAQGNHPWYFKAEYNGNQLTGMIERGNACVCHNDDLGEYGRYFMVFNTNGYAYTYRCVQNYFAYYINRSLSTATAYPEQYVTELSCSDPWYAMRMGEKILTSDLSGVTASEVKQITQNDSYCKFKILKKLTIPDLSATE